MNIERLDHFVLTVACIDTTIAFYERVLAMEAIEFAGGRRALRFGDQKINLHAAASPFPERAKHPTAGSGDFCLISKTPMDDVIDHLKRMQVEIIAGPVDKSGALGPILSVYFFDPDGNLVEISNYRDL